MTRCSVPKKAGVLFAVVRLTDGPVGSRLTMTTGPERFVDFCA